VRFPLRLHHLEHQAEVVEQREEVGDLGGVAVDVRETLRDRVGERDLAQDQPVQRHPLERHGRVRGVAPSIGQTGQRAVLEIHHVAPVQIWEHPVDGDAPALRLLAVEPYAEVIEEKVEAHRPHDVGAHGARATVAGTPCRSSSAPRT